MHALGEARRIVAFKTGVRSVLSMGRYASGAAMAIALLAGCARTAGTTVGAAHSAIATPGPKGSWLTPQPCVARNFNPSRLRVHAPTPATIQEIARVYRSEPALELRSTLNAYVTGVASTQTTQNLSPYGVELARDRFILLWIEPSSFGGWVMRLQFRHRMDTMYQVWLYSRLGSRPSVRYMLVVPCSQKQIETLNRIFAGVYALPYDG